MGVGIAAAVAGGLGLLGGERANMANRREAGLNRAFQTEEALKARTFTSAEAQRQMQFQERMRSTEWQTAVQDLEAAGLNKALAYSQGGAATPSGAMGGASTPGGAQAQQVDTISPSVASAMQYKRLSKDLEQQDANIDLTKAQTGVQLGNWRRLLAGPFNRIVNSPLGAAQQYFSGYGKAGRTIGSSAKSIVDTMGDMWRDSRTRGLIKGAQGDTRGSAPEWRIRWQYPTGRK